MRLALALAVLLVAMPAFAVPVCGDTSDTCQCGANNPYPCCDNGGNCTWFAWHSACCTWAVGLPGWGNANTWAQYASMNASYKVRSTPVVDSISCRAAGTYGHVAFVTSLNASGSITVREQNCFGNYGVRTYTYAPSFFTGGFIVRANQVQCNPGDSQQESCGNCGTRSRGCASTGKWGDWGACSDEGACKPDAVEAMACGDCGVAKRTCSTSCEWGAYSACESAPDAGVGVCTTSAKGACSAGVQTCVSGAFQCTQAAQPTAEACDGIDNDCDGVVDGPGVCATTQPGPSQPGQAAQDPMAVRGGCGGCAAAPVLEPLLLALWGLARRRSAQRL